MRGQRTYDLPTRKDYAEMLDRVRATTADALEEANRKENITLQLLYQMQLVDWDRLIERLRDNLH
jgi:hypothetical protein